MMQKTDIVPDKWYNHDDAYDGTGNKIYDGSLTYLKMRGNASTKFPKKNYQIKLLFLS